MEFWCTIAFGLLSIASVFQLISIASPNWVRKDIKNNTLKREVHFQSGLWEQCFHLKLNNVTVNVCFQGDNPDWLKATQGISICGLIACVLSIGVLLLRNHVGINRKILDIAATITATSAGIFIIIGIIIFASELSNLPLWISDLLQWAHVRIVIGTKHLSWAWYFGLAGGVLCFISAVLIFCNFKHNDYSDLP